MSLRWRVIAGSDRDNTRSLPGGLQALAVGAVDEGIAAAVRCFPSPPRDLAGWRAAAKAFADDCLDRKTQALLAVVLGPPFVAYVCAGDGFLVAQRDPGGARLVVPPESPESELRYGVLADTALSGIALGTDAAQAPDDYFDSPTEMTLTAVRR